MEKERKVSCCGRTCAEHQCRSLGRVQWTETCGGALLCVALCCLSLGLCVMVYVRTSELQDRVFSLEKNTEPQQLAFLEQLEPVLMMRLDRMLEEVSAFGQNFKTPMWSERQITLHHFYLLIFTNLY